MLEVLERIREHFNSPVKIKNIGKGVITLAPNVDDKFVALS